MTYLRSVYIGGMWIESGMGSGLEAAFNGLMTDVDPFQEPEWIEAGVNRGPPITQSGFSSESVMLNACLGKLRDDAELPKDDSVPAFFGLSGISGYWSDGLSPRQRALRAVAESGVGRVGSVHTNACVASTYAFIEAVSAVALGHSDSAVAIGARKIDRPTYELFLCGGAMSRTGKVRPFTKHRDGMLLGDAAGAVLLTSSKPPGNSIRVEGWGISGEGHDPVRPHPSGLGMALAIRYALASSGRTAGEIDVISAHGTGTPLNDASESAAYEELFGSDLSKVHVSASKSKTGHALEATGVLELCLLAHGLRTGVIPASSEDVVPDPGLGVRPLSETVRSKGLSVGLSVNAAFGGANAAVLLAGAA